MAITSPWIKALQSVEARKSCLRETLTKRNRPQRENSIHGGKFIHLQKMILMFYNAQIYIEKKKTLKSKTHHETRELILTKTK